MADIYRILFGREEIYNIRDKYVSTHRKLESLITLNGNNKIIEEEIRDQIIDVCGNEDVIYFLLLKISFDYKILINDFKYPNEIIISPDYDIEDSEVNYSINDNILISPDYGITINII